MAEPDTERDTDEIRALWDHAADAYAHGQASGRDSYRYRFFGPAQIALTGDVTGATLLDVGCGAGYFAREMAARGARVTAFDLSPRMLEHARAAGGDIAYLELDAAEVARRFAPASFDVITACMSLQDMPDPSAVLRALRAVVRPGGRLVASIEHPCTATPIRRWERDADGRKLRLGIGDYFVRGAVRTTWRGWRYEFDTVAYHATLADWLGWIRDAGFALHALSEPCPEPAAVAAHPELEDAVRVPYFLMFDLRPG